MSTPTFRLELRHQLGDSGELNADGAVDMIVASPNHDETGDSAGGAWVICGPRSGVIVLDHLNANRNMVFLAGEAGSFTGIGMAADDRRRPGAALPRC